jgi:glycosyltransferase involved in cell wall biosynthesis
MLVSVIIPTRDRAEYLRHSLAAALTIESLQVEILISDNASEDDTREVVNTFKDPRLRYINTSQRVSMRQNFEFALEESRGDYVIFFGDDDSILPGQFAALCKTLETYSPDGLSWDFPVYGWPVEGMGGKLGGFRIVKNRVFGQPYTLDVIKRRAAVASGKLYKIHPQPGIYHACMSRAYIKDKLAAADGTCILARSPDTYLSMRAIQYGGQFIHCNHPFSMNGYGSRSTGGSFGALGRTSKGRNAPTKTVFEKEIEGDLVEDVMPLSKSVPLGYLSTLETVRHHFPTPSLEVDYVGWYRGVIHDMSKKSTDTANHIYQTMTDYAASTKTTAQLQEALKHRRGALLRASEIWNKNTGKLNSFRVSATKGRINTIATAVQSCDHVLGTTYEQVLAGEISRRDAWTETKARYKQATSQNQLSNDKL